MNQIKNYYDLASFISFFKGEFLTFNKNNKFFDSDILVSIIALFAIKKYDHQLIKDYSYNRYFLDSLNVNRIPNSNELNDFLNDQECFQIIKKQIPKISNTSMFSTFLKKLCLHCLNKAESTT